MKDIIRALKGPPQGLHLSYVPLDEVNLFPHVVEVLWLSSAEVIYYSHRVIATEHPCYIGAYEASSTSYNDSLSFEQPSSLSSGGSEHKDITLAVAQKREQVGFCYPQNPGGGDSQMKGH